MGTISKLNDVLIANVAKIGETLIASIASINGETPGGGTSLFLDTHGTGIGAAYSFRKLSSTYTGDCIRVRRSTDNAELDIGFTSDPIPVLDEVALLAHTGTGATDHGFISKWYDQSGAFVGTPSALNDGDIANATTKQPYIVASGAVQKLNGFPFAADYAGAKIYLYNPQTAGSGNGWITGWGVTQDLTSFSVSYIRAADPQNYYGVWFGQGSHTVVGGSIGMTQSASAPRYLWMSTRELETSAFITGSTVMTYDAWHLGTSVWKQDPATSSLALDGVSQGSVTTYVNQNFSKIGWSGSAWAGGGFATEWLLYQTPPTALETAAMETDIITYYSI